jgi:starch phosphorylase
MTDPATPEGAALRAAFLNHLRLGRGKHEHNATAYDRYLALARTVRDRIAARWIETHWGYHLADPKRVYYLSAEFLLGRSLRNNFQSVGLLDEARSALAEMGIDFAELEEIEPDAGLGNGGLGRLAACFLDSLATLGYPAYGYGIRYEFGIFEQRFESGWQVERPDEWLRFGNPWEIVRPEYTVPVGFGGHTEEWIDAAGHWRVRWVPAVRVLGVPYDTPIAGFDLRNGQHAAPVERAGQRGVRPRCVQPGRLREGRRGEDRERGHLQGALPQRQHLGGRELRLKQQYFFVACAISDIVRRYRQDHADFSQFADKAAIQLNDTHPAVAVAELMRVLLDEHGLGWDEAWDITQRTFGYTNHTLLAEALERWPVALFERLLPRHLQLIYEINARFLRLVLNRWPNDSDRVARMSLIEEGPEKQGAYGAPRHRRLAQGQRRGRAAQRAARARRAARLRGDVPRALHQQDQRRDAAAVAPVVQPPPRGAAHGVHRPRLGDQPRPAGGFAPFADDSTVRARVRAIKRANKADLAAWLAREHRFAVDPDARFDVQIKRIHEYKRQLLNALHVVAVYLRAKRDPQAPRTPQVFPLRRQGRAGVPPGEGDHPLHQRRGRGDQPRPRRRSTCGCSSCPTTACRSPSASSPRRTSPSRLAPRARRPPARAT